MNRGENIYSLITVLICFAVIYLRVANGFIVSMDESVYKYTEGIYATLNSGKANIGGHNKVYVYGYPIHLLQLLLKEYEVHPLSDWQKVNELPDNVFVVAMENLNLDYYFDCVELEDTNDNYIWIKGNDLRAALEQAGTTFEHDTVLLYDHSELNSTIDEYEFRKSGLVKSGGVLFGPYIEMMPGRYQVTIRGERLNAGMIEVMATYNQGQLKCHIKVLSEASDHVRFSMEISETITDMEFPLWNKSLHSVVVDSISVERVN